MTAAEWSHAMLTLANREALVALYALGKACDTPRLLANWPQERVESLTDLETLGYVSFIPATRGISRLPIADRVQLTAEGLRIAQELHPFRRANGTIITAADRVRDVREMDADACRLVLALPFLQATVRKAAETRLRKLEGTGRR